MLLVLVLIVVAASVVVVATSHLVLIATLVVWNEVALSLAWVPLLLLGRREGHVVTCGLRRAHTCTTWHLRHGLLASRWDEWLWLSRWHLSRGCEGLEAPRRLKIGHE